MSKVFRVMVVPRDTFYHYQELIENGGVDTLTTKNHRE